MGFLNRRRVRGERVVPAHIGIIMDGNGRWAKRRGLPRTAGHYRGAEVFQRIVRYCEKIGVKALTVFAFSTENWSRPKDEVDAIMDLLRKYLKDAFGFEGESIKIVFIGERGQLDDDIVALMNEIEETSKDNKGLILNVALNYGGRAEILSAVKTAARSVADGEISGDDITEQYFNSLMYTHGSPLLDVILRPSGEQRISNFLLWQSAYCELIYMDVLWPDFSEKHLERAIEIYSRRERRFGGVG